MDITPLSIPGAFLITPDVYTDSRGDFRELYQIDEFRRATGYILPLQQANVSVSRQRTVRGIHYTRARHGQAKYVTCVRGGVEDYIVDLRVGSPTFGRHEMVSLDDYNRRAVFLPPGLGHGICALEDHTTLMYMCSKVYDPGAEKEIWALDPEIGLAFPWSKGALIMSDKDAHAPRLRDAQSRGMLPEYTVRHKI